jgi:hypothetical protein
MGEPTVCPKCGGAMTRGYVAECGHGQGRPVHPGVESTWLEGVPGAGGGHAASNRGMPVVTFRCGGCGFLESYAQPEPPAK